MNMASGVGAAVVLWVVAGCGGGTPSGSGSSTHINCPAGRTVLDGVCVSEAVADYVACVRAQGAQLGAAKSQEISAEAGAFGVKAGGAAEVSESLEKKYAASDTSMNKIIDACNSASGLQGTASAGAKTSGPAPSDTAKGSSAKPVPTTVAEGPDRLVPKQELREGQTIRSKNDKFVLRMQGDGHLVIYDITGGKAEVPDNSTWGNGTWRLNQKQYAVMQDDGNLVTYTVDGNSPTWSTGTHGMGLNYVVLEDSGELVLYRVSDNKRVWSNQTGLVK